MKEIERKKQIYHFLENQLPCNEKQSKLFAITQKEPCLRIKELKIKNFFSGLLSNYIDLVQNDFNENSILNIKDILKELKLFLKTSNFVFDGKISMEWHTPILLEYLDIIPQELTKNNCELLFNRYRTE